MEPLPLDPPLAKLFRDEPIPEPSEGARERVLARLETALPAFSPSGHGGHAPAPAVGAAKHVAARMVGVFLAGAIAGGGAVAVLRPASPERVVYVERSAAPPSLAPPAPASAPRSESPSPSASTGPPPSAVPPASSPQASAPRASGLADERLLLDDARARLSAGDANAALERLRDHERRFLRGQLVEEREALAIQALVNAGRYDEARARAAEFRKRSPNSVFLSVIDVTLGSIP